VHTKVKPLKHSQQQQTPAQQRYSTFQQCSMDFAIGQYTGMRWTGASEVIRDL